MWHDKQMLKSNPETTPEPSATERLTLRSLFDREESNLLRFAFALTGRREVAEEIVQEVFLQLHARWNEVESPQPWLFRCVRNRAFHYLRKCKRESLVENATIADSIVDSDEDTPHSLLIRMETSTKLRSLIDRLSTTDRQLVQLKYFEGLKYREIGERLGMNVGNVGYRLHQIMQKLATELKQMEADEES